MTYYGTRLQLSESYSATFNADGIATLSGIGPAKAGERWKIDSIQVTTDSSQETTVTVYRRSNPIAGSYSGNFDTAVGSMIVLNPGEALNIIWEHGTPGASALATIEGRHELRGNLAY